MVEENPTEDFLRERPEIFEVILASILSLDSVALPTELICVNWRRH